MKNSRNSEELRTGCIQVPVPSAEANEVEDIILYMEISILSPPTTFTNMHNVHRGERDKSCLSSLWFKLKHTSAQTVFKPNMHLFSVIKQTLIGCGCAKIRADWLSTALSEQACAAGDKLFWSGLRLYLQSRWLAWFKIAPSQSGCSWKTRSVHGPTKTSTLTVVLYALISPQNLIFDLCNSFWDSKSNKKIKIRHQHAM